MTELILTTPEALYEISIRAVRAALKDYDSQVGSDWMTTDEASEYLRITPNFIYRLVHEKRIPVGRAGGKLLFSKRRLDQWVEDGGLD